MAGPWRASDMTNNSLHVAFRPLRRLAAPWLAGHSAESIRSWVIWAVTEEKHSVAGAESRTRQQPEFWRITYVRRRQGRLCRFFRSSPWRSRGVLRRRIEVWRGDAEGARQGGRYRQAGGGRQPVQGQERIDARYPGAGGNQGGSPDRGRCR